MTQEQAIEKIKKLLRLGRSPNRNEAMAALATDWAAEERAAGILA